MSDLVFSSIKKIPWVQRRVERVYARGFRDGTKEEVRRISQGFFERTKDLYAGRRGFVIGNGPSLLLSDLERLRKEVTIASNKIYLAFEEIDWRPTFYSVIDSLLWKKIQDSIGNFFSSVITSSDLFLPSSGIVCYQFCRLPSSRRRRMQHKESPELAFSDDLRVGAYGGWTVTFENLQLAFHLGLNPIYLIGCDHCYAGEERAQPAVPVESSAENHFIKGYREPGELVNPAPIELMTEAYQVAESFASKNGRKIYNATRGGHLEVFERRSFDRLFLNNR